MEQVRVRWQSNKPGKNHRIPESSKMNRMSLRTKGSIALVGLDLASLRCYFSPLHVSDQNMEEFKSLEELTKMDEKHWLMGGISGVVPDLNKMHEMLSGECLNEEVPEDIKGQFNVARNMAIYTYFFYALAPEVHLKTYTIIEFALKFKANSPKRLMLGSLLQMAVDNGWISDAGFRHIEDSSEGNEWCKSLKDSMRKLRNSQAHGSSFLVGDCLHHVRVCADFINQLFPGRSAT